MRPRMNKIATVAFVCLIAFSVVGTPVPSSTGQATADVGSPGRSASSSQLASSQNDSLVVKIIPDDATLYQNESKLFHLVIQNPPGNDERFSGFLYAGYEVRDQLLSVTIAGQRPNVRYRNVTARYLKFNLTPGGKRVFPILIHRDSEAGNHRLNTTVRYFKDWNLTKKSSVSLVNIRPIDCRTRCQIRQSVTGMVTWIENNWEWLVSLLSLSVAILSLVAPNRVRRFVGLSEVPSRDSSNK